MAGWIRRSGVMTEPGDERLAQHRHDRRHRVEIERRIPSFVRIDQGVDIGTTGRDLR